MAHNHHIGALNAVYGDPTMPKKKTAKANPTKTKTPAGRSQIKTGTDLKGRKLPVIGLGASAGGLEALKAFMSKVSEDSGMAYIVVVHMPPKQPSMMPELLQKVTPIPVSTAIDGQSIEPNHIYVIPPDKEIAIYKGKIQLLDTVDKGAVLPIDFFLRSLAQDQGSSAAAIILSGTGTDGTLGVKEIKANDGLVLVQDEESAGYDGMPRSAVSTGLVDMVLPPEEMPAKLIQYFKYSKTVIVQKLATAANDQREWLNKIFTILRAQVGHDFSAYKVNTILRRIGRRMGLNHIDSHEMYVRYLRENPVEVEALFRELLIGVTSFFRDIESFEVLKTSILPQLLEGMKQDATFRAWVPGCSTGEEVYSLAIVLRECLNQINGHVNLQLFGTDIDNYAIEKAREGLFPASITADIDHERLKRFFTKEGDFYRIRKKVRECAVFSVQDLIRDPPFSRLDLLCCRNLLIYLDTAAQKKLLPLFHYTLKPNGILVLGSSETIGEFGNLFQTVDKKWKIFRRREVPAAYRNMVDFPSGPAVAEPAHVALPAKAAAKRTDISNLTKKAILDQFSPTAILIDAKGKILHYQGRSGKYLETPSGLPTNNILDLAKEGLRIELSSALRAAKSTAQKVTRKSISIKVNGEVHKIDLHVSPQNAPKELAGRFLVVFEDIDTAPTDDELKKGAPLEVKRDSPRLAELERELQITRESHQTTIEELESSNEELKSTNEEMQSANEELQSTNEELESSKEELQSLNEELQTVNAELQSKVEELSVAHDDMRNLLNGTEIATIFVDSDMRIRRFTSEATTIVNLIQTDIGRPLQHVASNLNYDGMITDLVEVMDKLIPKEIEVQTAEGKWYIMRIMPYRTTDNRIDGGVLTFSSIEDQKRAQDVLKTSILQTEQSEELIHAIFDMNPDPMAVLDKDGKIVISNTGFSKLLGIAPKDLAKMEFEKMHTGIPKQQGLESKLKTALKQGKDFTIETVELKSQEEKIKYTIEAKIIKKEDDFPYRILIQYVNPRQ